MQHLEPHKLQFAIATSLLVLFILMVTPLAKLLKHGKAAWEPKEGVKEPLLLGTADDNGGLLLTRPVPATCKLPSTPSCWSYCLFSWVFPSEAVYALEGCTGANCMPRVADGLQVWMRRWVHNLPAGQFWKCLIRSLCKLSAVSCMRSLWLVTGEGKGRSWRQWLGLGMGRKGLRQQGSKEGERGSFTGLTQTMHGSTRKPASAFADMSQRQAACSSCVPLC